MCSSQLLRAWWDLDGRYVSAHTNSMIYLLLFGLDMMELTPCYLVFLLSALFFVAPAGIFGIDIVCHSDWYQVCFLCFFTLTVLLLVWSRNDDILTPFLHFYPHTSCDFVLHFGHAYTMYSGSVDRGHRSHFSLTHMGPSILAAAFTTFAAAVVMVSRLLCFL